MIPAHIYCSHCGTRNGHTATFCFSCRQLAHTIAVAGTVQNVLMPSPLTISAGTILRQRYRVLQPIARGGMGAVYMGEDMQLGNRLVAIKEMSQFALSPAEIQVATSQFKREAHLLASLNHPNLMTTSARTSAGTSP